MNVGELRDRDDVDWDAFVRGSADGTPFHLTAWKRAIERTFGHRSHYLVARRAGAIEGVLPLFEVPSPLRGRALVSVPYAVYGGLCAATDDARRALIDAATARARRCSAGHVELRHLRDQGLDLPTKDLYVAFAREISGDDEQNLAAIPRKQRRMVRQGDKHGLVAEIGHDGVDACYDVYAESVRNLGSPVFPRRLFHEIHEGFGKECQILLVKKDRSVVAGVLSLFYADRVLPYYGGARRAALPYAVNDFMYWELMRYAAAAGGRIFDFGRSRVGTGAYDFKRHWGFEPRPLPYQYVLLRGGSMPNLSPSNPRIHRLIRVWQRLPLAVTNRIGPWLTRYLP